MDREINLPIAKATGAIASAATAQIVDTTAQVHSIFADLFVFTWPNIAAMCAALYSFALLIEFCWKKFWRPLLERLKWIKPKTRRVYSAREWAEIMANRDSENAPL